MSRNILIAALALGSVSAQAETPTFTLTASSANGGADTLFTWNYTGTLTFTSLISGPARFQSYFTFVAMDPANTGRKAYSSFDPNASFGWDVFANNLTTGLVMTNTTTGDFESPVELSASNQRGTFIIWNSYVVGAEVILLQGESVTLSGPTSGSFLSDVAFTGFNVGQWTTPAATQSGDYYTINYDTVFIVAGAPVPEPSTYGLALGGLALVGAVIRRRRSK